MGDPAFAPVTLAIALVTASCEPAQPAQPVSPRPTVEWSAPEPTASVELPPVAPAAAGSGPAGSPAYYASDAEDVIRRQIHPGAKRCFQRALEKDPTQVGRIVILVRVDDSGAVADAHVAANYGMSTDLGECIASVARRAVFARQEPGGRERKISIPFNFKRMTTPMADAGP